MEKFKLNDGREIPSVGIGTFLLSPDEAEKSVLEALKVGYRLIDTANAYQNERAVGRAIKASGIPREEIFVETKLWPSVYTDPEAIDKTLKRLDLDYIDLLLLHQPAGDYITGYKMLEKALKEGKVKSIGISNFYGERLDNLLNNIEIKPAVTQVETHPYYPQTEMKERLSEYETKIQAWYPLGGRGNDSVLTEDIIKELANKYGKSPAQIILRWHNQKGVIVIPGSKNPEHIKDNLNIFDFKLSDEDMKKIDALDKNTPFYNQTNESLDGFAKWNPDFDSQK
ncbi:MAG: aldo/keto reductase [Bacilli bacterium]|nr:aldo/keto reductase [Bacilli bacterium]